MGSSTWFFFCYLSQNKFNFPGHPVLTQRFVQMLDLCEPQTILKIQLPICLDYKACNRLWCCNVKFPQNKACILTIQMRWNLASVWPLNKFNWEGWIRFKQWLTLWIAPLYSVCCTAAVHLCKTMRILQEIKPLIFESVASLALL